MNKSDLKIIYMGTPDFAVESLKALVENNFNVVAVVTMPDKPIGRGYKVQSSPVKIYAESRNIPVLQPQNLKDESFLEDLKSYNADLQIVVAFRMLPQIVWAMPRLGTFNLHASLLPQYRGAAPINWAIINGEKETGVTTFFLQHEIDTGNIILQEKIIISDTENAGDIHDKLMYLGASLVVKTVEMILDEKVIAQPQPEGLNLKSAPKIFKETCHRDWNKNALDIYNFIRGLSPFPGAWFEWILPDKTTSTVKVFDSKVEICKHNYPIGKIIADDKQFKIAINDGFLTILSLQIPGKKRMNIEDFLRGFKNINNCFLNIEIV